MKKIAILLFLALAFSCERDDLCSEETLTTPRMVVEFRDLVLNENIKVVTGIRVEDAIDSTRVLTGYNGTSVNQIILPLKTDADTTQYRVYEDYNVADDGTIEGNPDVITITYTREDLYVSRACGYKTVYRNVIITIEPDADNWMDFAAPENDNQSVINEDEIHYTIRH
ncbi:DUF6452 family protein [Lacinutrix chionoecetis]